MTWNESKDTFRTRPDVPADEKLTASEWNSHVTDQENHSGRHEDGGSDELSVEGLSGVLADAQTPQTEAVEDIVGALLTGGTNISLTYDDANDVLTIDTSALNEEEVEDAVAALVTAGSGITVNYDDAAGTLSIAVDESALSFYDGTNLTADVDNQSVTTEELHNIADWVIDDLSDLESIPEEEQQGTIVIGQPDTPYRLSRWIDIDYSHVDLVCQSRYAKNGEPIVKIADGANVGGIRIGPNNPVEDVTVENYGHHGNSSNQDSEVKRLHGILVHDGQDISIEGCAQTRTHPYHEHNSGGSGLTVRQNSSDVTIRDNLTFDIGDRGIQVAGENIKVLTNTHRNGYDRFISLEVQEPDGSKYYSRNVNVIGNNGRNNSEGSMIGASGAAPGGRANWTIANNVLSGDMRGAVTIQVAQIDNVSVIGNVGHGSGNEGYPGMDININHTGTVVGNSLFGYDAGIWCRGNHVTVTGNSLRAMGSYGIDINRTTLCIANANQIRDTGDVGIAVRASEGGTVEDNIVTNNIVDSTTGDAIAEIESDGTINPNIITNNIVDNSITTVASGTIETNNLGS